MPAQLAVNTKQHLSHGDRIAINQLLDRFFPAAVERKDADVAWGLAGPEMRSGSSLAEFRRGTMPVPSYPAKEPNYHRWHAIDVEGNSVVLNVLVHPSHPQKIGSWVFSIEVVKDNTRWLVNSIYTIAVMNPPSRPATVTQELGPADYAAPPPGPQDSSSTKAASRSFLIPVAAILGVVLLIPLSLGLLTLLKAWRWRRAIRMAGRTELPPLPDKYRSRLR